ncbi:hypothetical protein [Planctomonas psychrotolerans]|uniref:hypothetical protein n=1 Tax=Planctomonas psychrotolerans TaxID=2528712 RepID=UPI00123B3DE3|nr:hypothetical protein [Planctomonas psychrotolerans]
MRKLLSFFLAMLVVTGGLVAWDASPQPAQALAVNGADFDPGFIISDEVFFNSNAMSEAQIQAFLTSTIGPCSNTNCLSVKKLDTSSRSADALCRGAYVGAAQESVARILYKVGQACGINPQVLIATLQKEQSLISGPIARAPSNSRLDRAMGYACPDNTVIPGYCDPAFGGVYNQLYKAAWQFKRYANPPGTSAFFTKFRPGTTANVQYNVPVSCGTKPVYIRNQATANLYYYTPYTPNQAALNNLYGTGNGCSAYGNRNFWVYFNNWFGSSTGRVDPVGAFDSVASERGGVRVQGWTLDPSTQNSITVEIHVNGVVTRASANQSRPDVARAYSRSDDGFGFSVFVSTGSGTHTVCAYGVNEGSGSNALLGCKTGVVVSGDPFGNLEPPTVVGKSVTFTGWTIDPDTVNPIEAHIYIDGSGIPLLASLPRADVARAFPQFGNAHGFRAVKDLSVGRHEVCGYGINVGGGSNTAIGCRSFEVKTDGSDQGRVPMGNFEALTASPGTVDARGWAIDPDTAKPIDVDVYVNGAKTTVTADQTRDDVARNAPGWGSQHGFARSIASAPGTSRVCVTAVNSGRGAYTELGCKTVSVPALPAIGALDGVRPTPGGLAIHGWAATPMLKDPIAVHVYVNGVGHVIPSASGDRPDVAAVYPQLGSRHGYTATIPVGSGTHTVCAYGVQPLAASNPLLGCKTVRI